MNEGNAKMTVTSAHFTERSPFIVIAEPEQICLQLSHHDGGCFQTIPGFTTAS